MTKELSLRASFVLRALVAAPCFVAMAACASSPPEETTTRRSALEEGAESAFERALGQAYADYDACVQDHHCPAGAERPSVLPAGARIRFRSGGALPICDALAPFAGLEHPYFFVGASLTGGALGVGQGGADIVWDLWNQQAALFGYGGGGIMSLVGVEASVYSGYGFGNKSSVVDAWSGEFRTGALSVGLPVLKLSAGASGFASPDGSVVGGAVAVSIGLDWIPTPVDGSFVVGVWTPFDDGTQALGRQLFFTSFTDQTTGTPAHHYLQFENSRSVAFSILQTVPTLGASAAAQAVAIGVLHDQGLSITQLCGVAPASAAPSAPATPSGPCDGKTEAECRSLSACEWTAPDPNDDTRTSGGCSERAPAPAPGSPGDCYAIASEDACQATAGCRWYLDLNDDTLTTAFCVRQDDPRR